MGKSGAYSLKEKYDLNKLHAAKKNYAGDEDKTHNQTILAHLTSFDLIRVYQKLR